MNDIQRDYLNTVMDSSESLLSIINDILDSSKIEAGKLEVEHVDFHLHDTVGDTVRAQGLRADWKGLELACFVDPAIADPLQGDPGRLRQVLTNLVSNAIKFTETGEVVVRVEQESNENGCLTLIFQVHDSGIGIAPNKLATVFEAFEQADMSTTREYGETGLGLAICEKLVSLMGGRIEVDSQLGCGSTFRFTQSSVFLTRHNGTLPQKNSVGRVFWSLMTMPPIARFWSRSCLPRKWLPSLLRRPSTAFPGCRRRTYGPAIPTADLRCEYATN